jgi:hypothetical protein
MVVGGEAAHVDADLGQDGLSAEVVEAWDREDMPDRLAIDAGGFHGGERASLLRKPRRQVQ